MANLYAQKLMEAVKGFNQPLKSTSTTTVKGNEGLDIWSLMMMLMMSQMFKQPKPTATAGLGALDAMPNPQSMASVPATLGAGAIPGLSNSVPGIDQLLQLLRTISL